MTEANTLEPVLEVGAFSIFENDSTLFPFKMFKRGKFIGEFISVEAAQKFAKECRA